MRVKMYNKGSEIEVSKDQVEQMEQKGWSKDKPENKKRGK